MHDHESREVCTCRHFEVVDTSDVKDATKLFSVTDFVGDACIAIASHVRGVVADVQFDDLHKVYYRVEMNSSGLKAEATFGVFP